MSLIYFRCQNTVVFIKTIQSLKVKLLHQKTGQNIETASLIMIMLRLDRSCHFSKSFAGTVLLLAYFEHQRKITYKFLAV